MFPKIKLHLIQNIKVSINSIIFSSRYQQSFISTPRLCKNSTLGTANYQGISLKSAWVTTRSQKVGPQIQIIFSFCACSLLCITSQRYEPPPLSKCTEKSARFSEGLLQIPFRCSCCRVGRTPALHVENINALALCSFSSNFILFYEVFLWGGDIFCFDLVLDVCLFFILFSYFFKYFPEIFQILNNFSFKEIFENYYD